MESPSSRVASNATGTAPDVPRPRRVMTAPVPPAGSTPASSQHHQQQPSPAIPARSDDLVETMFSHPAVRIISFTASQTALTAFLPASSDKDAPASLPPSSPLERTIAVGALQIYRAPGSVAFLSCGSALQPILPRSQCWCVDEDNSRFILQIRRPQYWRIEVPVTAPEDAHRAVLLRDVFDNLLLFEKTACPFQRSFTVDLPESPETPVKKKAWTAEGKNLLSSPFSDLSPPADTPAAISRGKRIYETSPTSAMSLHGLGKTRLRARDTSPGGAESHPEPQIGPLAQTVEHFLNMWETLGRRSTNASMYSSTPTGQVSGFPTSESGLSEKEALGEEKPAGPSEAHRIDIAAERLTSEKSHNAQPRHESLRFKGQERSPSPYLRTPSDSPDTVAAATLEPASSPDQKDDGLFKTNPSDGEKGPASFEGSGGAAPVNLARKRRTRMIAGRRSYTAPPPVRVVTSPTRSIEPVRTRIQSQPLSDAAAVPTQSPTASTDSFHSMQSWHSSATPPLASPPPATHPSDDVSTPKNTINVTSENCGSAEPTPRPTCLTTDQKSEDSIDASRSPTGEEKLPLHRSRSHASSVSFSRQALSSFPPATNLFSPPRQTPQSRFSVVRRLPSAIFRTVEIFFSPPSYLVKLMLKVAAMIVSGKWKGLVYGLDEAGEQIPVEWDYYSDGEFSDLSDSDEYTLSNQSSNRSDSASRSEVRRRAKRYPNDYDHDESEVD
ncbi:inheritance of peroxisomes protein 1-domain-containing protein [Astrocystis sublimbata]|nr:inheritance of peroxisomes protein 1-domain-containing protein [Astrocystis sublimbata]